MAEIITKYDTKTKKLEVSKDGAMVDNVYDVSFYRNGDDGVSCNIRQMEVKKDDGCTEVHSLYASKDKNDELVAKAAEYIAGLHKTKK